MRKSKQLPIESLAPYLLELPLESQRIDMQSVFENEHPVELEVGFGKGGLLVSAAESNPATNFLGIEIDRGLQLYTATRMAKRELKNVRLILTDARRFLREYAGDACFHAIHVYFPDPWWKKRHKKRRVFTEDFATQCERTLVPRGRLLIATDVEEYFGVMTQLVADHTRLVRRDSPGTADDSPTNFERKAVLRGGRVWRATYEKAISLQA